MRYFCWHDWTKWESYVTACGSTRQRRKCTKCNYETDSFVTFTHDPSQAARENKERVKEKP